MRFFNPQYEARRQDRDIALYQQDWGTTVLWWFFDPATSVYDPVYDEGEDTGGGGRRWTGPLTVPVLSANRREGQKQTTDDGFYPLDTMDLRLSYEQSRKVGLLPEMSQNTQVHLLDRVAYDGRIFGLRDISVTGQFEASGHDVVLRIQCVQLLPGELVNDPDFKAWSI